MTLPGPCILGVDVGGTSVRVVAEDAAGRRGPVLETRTPLDYDALIDAIGDLSRAATDMAPHAVACGLPGTVSGECARFVPALGFLDGRPFGADLAKQLGAPVRLANDAQLTLLAEAREGAARDCGSAVLVAVGTGIGGALLLDGRIFSGRHGSAGAFGWLPAAEATPNEMHGAFELAASGSALSAIAAARRPGESGEDLVAAARRAEPDAVAAVTAYAERLGRGIAAIASVIDPDVVLVGGGLSEAMDLLGPVIERSCQRYASPDGRTVPVRPAALGARAGVTGALYAARPDTEEPARGSVAAARLTIDDKEGQS